MARNVIGLITGLVVGFIVVAGIEMINYGMFPLPPELAPDDRAGMLEHIKTLPPLAYIIVIVAHIAGAFLSAVACTMIASTHHRELALGLGTFFMIMGLINLVTIPHPIWFSILDTLVYIPAAFLGFKFGIKRVTN